MANNFIFDPSKFGFKYDELNNEWDRGDLVLFINLYGNCVLADFSKNKGDSILGDFDTIIEGSQEEVLVYLRSEKLDKLI